jgi:small subunit ribosomal protein S1
MVQEKNNREEKEGLPPCGESWWEAVLEEVETYTTPKEDKTQTPTESPRKGSERSLENGSVNWERAEELYKQDQIVMLEVSGYNQGGLLVNGKELQGFVPLSHLVGIPDGCDDQEREETLAPYMGSELRLKVIECDPERGRVVFSERAALADPGRRIELLENLEVGNCVQGKVTTITDFGAFVDLGGVEGLIHISEISWGRVQHPRDVLTKGQTVKAHILQLDRERARVALSLKRLDPNPWETVEARYQAGQIVDAVVTSVVSYGAFARLEKGLDGLIHISELGEQGKNVDPREILHEGQSVQVRILHVDPSRQRLGLSLAPEGEE